MATVVFSQVKGSAISFNPALDVLYVDYGSAADVNLKMSGTTLTIWLGTEWVSLLNVSNRGMLSTGNVSFADGSMLLIGDNTSATSADSSANTLLGGAGNDSLIGMGGNDYLNGGEGSDTYVILGSTDGVDKFRDSGTTGIDRIVAGANNAVINLGSSFRHALTGIEVISSEGKTGVKITGSSSADVLDFTGVTLTGIASIDGMAGSDTITGSAGNDTIKGGSGNDTIDGAGGSDTAVFAGARSTYTVTNLGGYYQVRDLDTVANGNDGTDTVRNVEYLKFSDALVDLTVPNRAPTAVSDVANVAANAGATTINVLANDTDPDIGDTKTVVAADGNGREGGIVITAMTYGVGVGYIDPGTPAILGTLSIAPGGQGLVYNPGTAFRFLGSGQTATETIFYTMADSSGAQSSSTLSVRVQGVNDGPTAVADSATVSHNAAPVALQVLANDLDPDAGDTRRVITVDTAGTLGSVSIAADGSHVVYAVGSAFQGLSGGLSANDSFTYTMVDAAGVSSTATVALTITSGNSAPVAVADTAAVTENSAALTINVLANDTDADAGDTRSVLSVNTTGLQGSATVTAGGTAVSYAVGNAFQSLRAGQSVSETFSYTMVDSGGAQSTANVTVTIAGVNDAPVAVANAFTVAEDGGAIALNVLANDVDVDAGDTRIISAIGTTGLKGTASIAADGASVQYTAYQSLRAGQIGTDTFTYTVRDSAGATSSASVTVTVTGANDAPTAVNDSFTLGEDAAATTLAVLSNDTDLDAGDTRRVVSVDNTGLLGSVSIATNGTGLIYSPGAAFQHLTTGQSASETFSYTMQDSAGVQSTASVTVHINGATDGPRAVNDTAAAHEDGGPITLHVLNNDFNPENPADQFTVTAIDGAGQFASLTLILIYGVGVGQFNPGFPRLLGQASIGPDGKTIQYTPLQSLNAGEVGTDTFKYIMKGTGGQSATGIVTVTVTGANDAPTAVADAITVEASATATFVNVLANDTDPDTRVDPPAPPADELGPWDATPADVPDTKTVVAVNTSGLQGSVAIAANGGGVLYTPGGALLNLAYGQSATETFSYTMQDGAGAQSTASVTVTITGTNHGPVAVNDVASAVENGAPINIAVLANDTDADLAVGDTLTLTAVNAAGLQGSVSLNGNAVTYTVGNAFQHLRAGVTATETFSYTVADAAGDEASAQVAVTITGVNDAPVAVANSYSLSEDAAPATLLVLANDTDVDAGDTKTIVAVNTAGLQGSVAIAADGQSLVYTVASAFQSLLNGQSATESFSYTLRDSAGAESSASVNLTILGANEPVIYVNPPAPGPGAIQGTSGDDIINGTSGADVIYGHAGDDEIYGLGGADTLYGGADDDDLDGGAGNDILNGGAGRDDLTGDTGADLFRFYLASESTLAGFDSVRDFNAEEGDKIDLSLIDANSILAGNNEFIWSSSFNGTAGQLKVDTTASGYLVQGDVNGDAIADLAFEVRLHSSMEPLVVTDFLL